MSANHILAIDQGTTSTRAVVYNDQGISLGSAAQEFAQHFPAPAWVEHDAEEIWQTVVQVVPRALAAAKIQPSQLAGIGLTNQRETVLLWDRASSKPLGRAMVWQDRRTAPFCKAHRADEKWIFPKTGLVLDPYFSASKIAWFLEQGAEVRRSAEAGRLACGTIDSWLLWNLTRGKTHATDASNASRTLLLDLHRGEWDEDLCRFFQVPAALLPEIKPSAANFGVTANLGFLPAGIPIAGMVGDQQSALFGQGGFDAGDAKCTYGTGAFFLQQIGSTPLASRHRLLTSLAALPTAKLQYVLEGSVFIAGAAVQWLRDALQFFARSPDVEDLANQADLELPVLFVPALVGLGAPHWVPEARGVLFGLTRNTTRKEVARAVLEGVALQVVDLIDAAGMDLGQRLTNLRVDGGMAGNAWFLQRQADFLGFPVLQSAGQEATARGAAFLAGLKVGLWPNLEALRQLLPPVTTFSPALAEDQRYQRLQQWRKAVQAVIRFYQS